MLVSIDDGVPEDLIHDEIKRLDRITNEKAAELPVFLNDGVRYLGQYTYGANERFSFSRQFFSDSSVSRDDLIKVIHHEYCHYLNRHWFGQQGHGYWFMYCRRFIEKALADEKNGK